MHADNRNEKILLNRHLKATSQACAVVSNVLDFDSVELWVQDGAGSLTCVFVYATDEVSKEHPVVRTTKTFYPTNAHNYSPQVFYNDIFTRLYIRIYSLCNLLHVIP